LKQKKFSQEVQPQTINNQIQYNISLNQVLVDDVMRQQYPTENTSRNMMSTKGNGYQMSGDSLERQQEQSFSTKLA
jgi:hypothetical protein